ncbi:hypothetical protein HYT51_01115 [Candidatus Woesearchaeota archaeon]|nr:hypothetical protein [Candidatus Woesearchaeota archaeon]
MGLLDKVKEQKRKDNQVEKKSLQKQDTFQEKKEEKSYLTGVDQLYYLLEDRNKISFNNAAEKLNISIDDVEEWANVLAKENLVEIKYPALRSPEIIKKSDKKIKKEDTKQEKQLKVAQIRDPTKTNKRVKTKKTYITAGIFIILLVIGIFIYRSQEETSDASEETEISASEETVSVQEAFSGKGNYKCDFEKEGVTAAYYIKDKEMRVDTRYSGISSSTLYSKGFLYTYLEEEDKWYKSRPSSDAIFPSSERTPGEDVITNCYKLNEANETLFILDPEKVVL